MKKVCFSSLFILMCFACSCEILSAQTFALNEADNGQTTISKQQGRRHGGGLLKIGLGINYLNVGNPSPKLRFTIGLAPTFPLNEKYYVKPEMSFSLKGGNASYNGYYFDGNVTYRLSYLEFPLMFGFKPSNKIAFEFGGYGAFLLSGNFDFSRTFASGYGDFNQGELNNFDYGLGGGVVLSRRRIKLGIRYYQGLQEVASTSAARTFLGNATNHTIQIYIQRVPLRERLRT